MRKDRDPKVNTNASDGLAPGLVDGDQKCQTHQELATLQLEQKCCVVFGWQECDSRDELGLPVVVAPDYFDLQYPVRHPRENQPCSVAEASWGRQIPQEDERTTGLGPQFTWGKAGCSEGGEIR